MEPLIVCAAIIPIVVAFTFRGGRDQFVVLDIVSWLIFLADLIVHMVWQRGYLHTRLGKFDATIVVISAPWFLIPALGSVGFLGLARLGRLARLALASGSTTILRRLAERLGKAGLYAVVLIFVCAAVVYRAEPPSSGYATYGDALWWAVVTFTTVGYGDLVPVTTEGRFTAVFLMVGGIALIGVLAGSMSELFAHPISDETDDELPTTVASLAPGADASSENDRDADEAELLAEVRALRSELADLQATLVAGNTTTPRDESG